MKADGARRSCGLRGAESEAVRLNVGAELLEGDSSLPIEAFERFSLFGRPAFLDQEEQPGSLLEMSASLQ